MNAFICSLQDGLQLRINTVLNASPVHLANEDAAEVAEAVESFRTQNE